MDAPGSDVGLMLWSSPTLRPLEPITNTDDIPDVSASPAVPQAAQATEAAEAAQAAEAAEAPMTGRSSSGSSGARRRSRGSKEKEKEKDKEKQRSTKDSTDCAKAKAQATLLPTSADAAGVAAATALPRATPHHPKDATGSRGHGHAGSDAKGQDAWLKVCAKDWKTIRDYEKSVKDGLVKEVAQEEEEEGTGMMTMREEQELQGAKDRRKSGAKAEGGSSLLGGFGWNSKKGGKRDNGASPRNGKDKTRQDSAEDANNQYDMKSIKIPDEFEGMMAFNARIVGANVKFIDLVLKRWDTLVASVTTKDDFRLAKETRVIALRLYTEKVSKPNDVKEFRICMLASLRPLLPSYWDSVHEKAWESLWDSIAEALTASLSLPQKYHREVEVLVNDLSCEDKRRVGFGVFKRLFKLSPQTEFYFKQNNERLASIVVRAMGFTLQIFASPNTTVDELTALGLKHIMWSIPTEYFEPFMVCCVQEVQEKSGKPDSIEAFAWALEVVASILVLTIEDGSSPLLTAVLKNSSKMVKKELSHIGRAQRPCSALGAISLDG